MRFIITVRQQLSYNRQFLVDVLQFNFSFIYTKSYCGLMLAPTKKKRKGCSPHSYWCRHQYDIS